MGDFEMKAVEKKTGKLSAHTPSLQLGRTEQFLITGDNYRLLPAQRWHQKNLYNKPY